MKINLCQDLHIQHIAVAVQRHTGLHLALEALLAAHHIIRGVIQLLHCAHTIGGSVGICQRQSRSGHRGAAVHQPAKAKRHGKRCRTHGRIAGQPPAPQGLRRMICLLQFYHLPV